LGLRDYLQLFRAHTAPASVLTLVVPYLIAGGRDPVTVLLLFALGHLVHYFSFGHNSLMDYSIDIRDPSKKHHPLVAGRISLEDATRVVLYGQALTGVATALLVLVLSENPALSLLFFSLYILWGHAYNDGLDHRDEHSWLSISLCAASATLVSYTFVRGLDLVAVLLFAWGILLELYEVGLLGNAKDLWNPAEEKNPLRRWAVYESGEFRELRVTRGWIALLAFFCAVRLVASTAVVALVAVAVNAPLANTLLLVSLTAVEAFAVTRTVTELASPRPRRCELLSLFGLSESVEYFRLASLAPMPWPLLLVAYGLTYYVGMNKLLWGTTLGPRV
jgi:4-hydroxybenzoate polyprenyltransferase